MNVHEALSLTRYCSVNRFSDINIGDDFAMSIGQRIKLARTEKGMSQMKLRSLTGIGQSTLSDLENNLQEGTTYAASLAAALGVSALWLAEGKGSMLPVQVKDPGALDDVVLLINLFRDSSPSGRDLILATARLADKG